MGEANPAIPAVQDVQPFDAVAAEYDSHFTHHQLGRWLREAVHRHLADLVQPGAHVLELGCGTGEDALWLARHGAHVTATDASAAMLKIAARKTAAAGLSEQITFAQVDLLGNGEWGIGSAESSPKPPIPYPLLPTPQYDAVLANFGVLNCLPDRRALASTLARWVRPGGRMALVVMSPICPWEIIWHLAHGQIRTALRRFRSGVRAHVGRGTTVRVWYPSPRRLQQEFTLHFHHVQTVGIGTLLPPSYLAHLVNRWPHFFEHVAGWDQQLGQRWPWTWLNDHYLAIFERK